LGKGEKYILPEAFFYMISLKDKKRADEAFDYVYNTLERAAANIYDTVEGGFFRYAEERGWQTPHYEKLTDLNAGTVLLLHNLNAARPSPDFKKAADKTASYIMSKLFDSKNGAFLSYQSADESYYLLDADNRKKRAEPLIGEKIFIDRLSVSLYYMLESLKYFQNTEYEKRWLNKGSLSDHAYLANGFMKAFSILNEPEYLHLSNMIIKEAQKRFYDKDKGIFIERVDGKAIDLEYQLELNGIIALTLLSIPENKRDEGQTRIIKDIITYFSNINDLFEERLWGADGWRFMERYVPYLKAADIYFSLN
jgi:uncharacterized protein YyaL (SSP411 family)